MARAAGNRNPAKRAPGPGRKKSSARANTRAKPKADEGIRLQKVLAQAGIASRRAAEEMIVAGRVFVNERVAKLGQRVDPAIDRIEVDGGRLPTDPKKRYLLLNKPSGVITSVRDPEGRRTVLDLVEVRERVFPVGRLDYDTEGLLLLTNDGDLTNRLTHPSFEVPKVYIAEVEGSFDPAAARGLVEHGVRIGKGRPAKAKRVRIVNARGGRAPKTAVELTLHEGRKHVVREMLEALGHPVTKLVRTSIGPIKIGRLRPGEWRELSPGEVAELYRSSGA